MREVLEALDRWQEAGEAMALATLVRVHGSAPRLPGARLLATASGKMAGSVSGGCVENDIVTRALQVMADGAPVLARYGIADDSELAVGLTCAEIDVLIEPFRPTPAWQAARAAIDRHAGGLLAVALAPEALVGRALAVDAVGAIAGGIAGDLDAAIVAAAAERQTAGGTGVIKIPRDVGRVEVFVEIFTPPLRLIVCGGSHPAVALARMAKQIGMHVTVIDARSAYIRRERFPDADLLLHASPARALPQLPLEGAFVVTLTHDLKFDVPALACALRSGAAYVGAMGSLKTHARRCAELRALGFAPAELARIRTPIGLDLGSRSPEEIAVAILAEVLAVRSGRDAAPLRDRRVGAPRAVRGISEGRAR